MYTGRKGQAELRVEPSQCRGKCRTYEYGRNGGEEGSKVECQQ